MLIGNDRSRIGELLSKRLMRFGYMSDCTANRCDAILKELSEKNYYCVIVFVPKDESKVYDFLREIRAMQENILIITIIYGFNFTLYSKLTDEDINKCIMLPASVNDICKSVIKVVESYDSRCFRSEISEYLSGLKFPEYLSGFDYLCTAIEICVQKQQYKKFSTMDLYEEIGRRMNVKASCVERSLRHFSKNSLCRSSVANILKTQVSGKISNSKLISKTATMFAKEYGYTEKTDKNICESI